MSLVVDRRITRRTAASLAFLACMPLGLFLTSTFGHHRLPPPAPVAALCHFLRGILPGLAIVFAVTSVVFFARRLGAGSRPSTPLTVKGESAMCLIDNASTPKSRRMFSIGRACLVVALTSQALDLTFGLRPDPLHFLRGLLIGVSLATSIYALRLRAHLRAGH